MCCLQKKKKKSNILGYLIKDIEFLFNFLIDIKNYKLNILCLFFKS